MSRTARNAAASALILAAMGLCRVTTALAQTASAVQATPAFAAGSAAPAAGVWSGASQLSLALLVVIGCIFALAALMRRLRLFPGPGARAGGIEILAQVALGTRERAVLLRVGRERVLVGVGQGVMQPLLVLEPEQTRSQSSEPQQELPLSVDAASSSLAAAETRPNFADMLRRSLGR